MYKVGFANLDERSPYAVQVREGLEREIAKHDDIELICRDNALDDARAEQNAREFVDMGVDAVVMYHINENIGNHLRTLMMPIPIISVDIPIPFTSYVGINNDEMGEMASECLQEWINTHWDGKLQKILGLLDSRVRFAQSRTTKVVELIESGAQARDMDVSKIYLDMRYDHQQNYQIVHDMLSGWSDQEHIAIINYNDTCALIAFEAVEALGLTEKAVFVVQGLTHQMIEKVEKKGMPIIGVMSFPDTYGETLMPVLLDILHGRKPVLRTHVPLELADLTRKP